jgi:Flagellar FliJ protein.
MKKFEFQLEKLLSYKGQILDSEMMTLAVLNDQLTAAQRARIKLQAEQEQCGMEFASKMKQRTTPAACQTYSLYKEHLKMQILNMDRKIAGISAQVDKQIDLIKKLKLETKSLETLKTARYDEYKKEDQKAAEQQLEEFVSTAKLMKMSV